MSVVNVQSTYVNTSSGIKCVMLFCTFLHPDPPVYSLLPNRSTTVLEGEDFTYSFGLEAKPTSTNFTWSRDGQVISSGARIATSVSNITITSTTRSDSGVYEVVSYNEAGRGAANFTLDVQCEPCDPIAKSPCSVILHCVSFYCFPAIFRPSRVCQHCSSPTHSVDGWS